MISIVDGTDPSSDRVKDFFVPPIRFASGAALRYPFVVSSAVVAGQANVEVVHSPPNDPVATGQQSQVASAPGAAEGHSKPLVLVVDEEAAIRRVVEMMLRQLGFETLSAANGEDALKVFEQRQGQIQAVLLDLTMSRMDGLDVLAAMRKLQPAIPVVLCSGYSIAAVPGALLAEGRTTFLHKPFTMAELDRTIREAIQPGN